MRELQSRLLSLSDERDRSLAIIDEVAVACLIYFVDSDLHVVHVSHLRTMFDWVKKIEAFPS